MNTQNDTDLIRWRFHFANFHKELIENNSQNWIFQQPMNVLKNKLVQIAERAAEIKDPVLLDLCASLALYEFSDPRSKDYDEEFCNELRKKALKIKKQQ